MRTCVTCAEEKSIEGFNKNPRYKDGYTRECKVCMYARARKWARTHRAKINTSARNSRLIIQYGIDILQYEQLLLRQGMVCAICRGVCKSGRRLAVDHDHRTGAVRGLLCGACNRAIGNLGDSVERLRRAIEYLEKVSQPASISVAC